MIDRMVADGCQAVEDERERTAIELAEALTLRAHNIPEELWTRLRQHYDEGETVEIAAVAALFNGFNRFNDALEVEVPR